MAKAQAPRMGIDLSGPVRVVLVSGYEVLGSFTAHGEFDTSKRSLAALAQQIKEFWQPLGPRPDGYAGLSDDNSLLFTVPMEPLNKKEFKQAMHLQVERFVPGGSNTMRMTYAEWPQDLPLPPSSEQFGDAKTYLVTAAESQTVQAAQKLMVMAGVKPVQVEISALAACRGSMGAWKDDEGTFPVRLNMALVVNPQEALLYLAFDKIPWLKREIPLDLDNPFVNAQVIAGEISRSARFAASSLTGEFSVWVTAMGASDRIQFLADYLTEQAGIGVKVWGLAGIEIPPEYGVAVGVALPRGGDLL